MKVAELLDKRRANWRELEILCLKLESSRTRAVGAEPIARFAALYRAACADLALADAYQLPHNTVSYLHQLVGRAHNQLYHSQSFNMRRWAHDMLFELPQRLFNDGCLRLAFFLFFGTFFACMAVAAVSPTFAEQIVGQQSLDMLEDMYAEPIGQGGKMPTGRASMAGFYVMHNAGIGLKCFAAGMFLGVGGILITLSNAAQLGTMFGHMAISDMRDNFFIFVTAHGPFELTAIVLSAAAGMRLGFALVDTRGYSRSASMRRAGIQAVPLVSLAVLLFCAAACIEAFISPSPLPYMAKAVVAVLSAGVLTFYFVVLGFPREAIDAA